MKSATCDLVSTYPTVYLLRSMYFRTVRPWDSAFSLTTRLRWSAPPTREAQGGAACAYEEKQCVYNVAFAGYTRAVVVYSICNIVGGLTALGQWRTQAVGDSSLLCTQHSIYCECGLRVCCFDGPTVKTEATCPFWKKSDSLKRSTKACCLV